MDLKKTRFTLSDLFAQCAEHVRSSVTYTRSCSNKLIPSAKQAGVKKNCSQTGCGCSASIREEPPAHGRTTSCSQTGCGCSSLLREESPAYEMVNSVFDKPVSRRQALGMMVGATVASTALAKTGVNVLSSDEKREKTLLKWQEYFKGNFQVMTDTEKAETIQRLERLAKLEKDVDLKIKGSPAQSNVLYGYAFNISKMQRLPKLCGRLHQGK